MKKAWLVFGFGLLFLALGVPASGQEVFATGLKGPENLAFDGKGSLYVSDTNHLWLVDTAGNTKELYARDPGVDGISLGGVSLGPEGKIYFSAGNAIKVYDPAAGAAEVFVSGFSFANGNCFDDAGDLFIADSNARKLWVVPAGTRELKLLKEKIGRLPVYGVNGLVWERGSNTLYYTANMPAAVGAFRLGPGPSIVGQETIVKFPSGGLDDLTLDADGNLYVCMWINGKLVKVTPGGDQELLLEGLDGPSAVEFAPGTGELYILIKGGTAKFAGTEIIKLSTGSKPYQLPYQP